MQDFIFKSRSLSDTIALLSNNKLNGIALSKIKTFKNDKTLQGHSNNIWNVAGLPNGKVISGSWDNTLKVWDVATGQCLNTLNGHSFHFINPHVNCVAALPNGKVISGSGHGDNTLKIWDTATGQCLNILQGHNDCIMSVAVLRNGKVISGSRDNTLKVWDVTTGRCLNTLEGHSDFVWCVAELSNGWVISGSSDKTLKVWDVATGQCLNTLNGYSDSILSVAVLRNGKVISGSGDNTLKVWDVATGRCLNTLLGHSGFVWCVAELSNGWVISGSSDKTLKVWDVATGQCLNTLNGHSGSILSVAVLPNGQVVSGSRDNTLKVWENLGLSLQELRELLPIIEKNTSLIQLDMSNISLSDLSNNVGTLLFSLCANKKIEILELSSTGLTDSILDKCIPAILAVPLKILDLSYNKLTYGGVRVLFEKLYNNRNYNLSIQKIILSGNLIEVDDVRKLKDLYDIYSQNDCLELIDLSGNLIFSENRQKELITMFILLLNKSGLAAGEFLTLQFHSLKKISANAYAFELKKENNEIIQILLTHKNIQDFNALKETIKESTDSDVFEYITSNGIKKRILEIDDDLRNKKYNALETHEEKNALVKKLIDYHPQAPLKSYVNTHSIFCHSPFTKAQSLLLPEQQITYETGRVYLLAKTPKNHIDEHAMIAYELINGQNQRFFKVAHLTTVSSHMFGMSVPRINFFAMGINELITYLQERFLIASFSVKRKNIKKMHVSIIEDVKELKNTKYKFMVSSSNQSKEDSSTQIKNCLTWAWDKIKDHGGYQINITLSMYPSTAVKWLIDNPDKLYMQGEMTTDKINWENTTKENPNENCIMM